MKHEIHPIIAFEITAPYTLRLTFEDRSVQVIDFLPILVGADFDPALLHDWPRHVAPFSERAKLWAQGDSRKVAEPSPMYGQSKP